MNSRKKWLESLPTQVVEMEVMIDTLRETGGKVSPSLTSQLCLVGLLDSLARGEWQSARCYSLTLAELLPDYLPSLRVALR